MNRRRRGLMLGTVASMATAQLPAPALAQGNK
jgi:hypothetical protein